MMKKEGKMVTGMVAVSVTEGKKRVSGETEAEAAKPSRP